MHCLLLVLPALFVGSLAAPGGYSLPTNNGAPQQGSPLSGGAPQIIPSGNGAGGFSRQWGNQGYDAGAAQAAADQAGGNAGGFSNQQNAAGGAPLGGAGAGGVSAAGNNVGGALGGTGGGASNAAGGAYGGQAQFGGASNAVNGNGGGTGLGAPVIIPNEAGTGGLSVAGGEVNQAGLLAGQELRAEGMSAGAAAGIAIGVIAVAALGTAVAVMILRR